MLRGRLVKLGDRLAEEVKAPPEVQWVLNGDRGLSYSATRARGLDRRRRAMVAGRLRRRAAGLVRGRHRQGPRPQDRRQRHRQCARPQRHRASIANLREVKWESLALNFVLVFSPNTLVGAPHNLLVTVTLPKDAPLATEAKLAQQIGRAFPAIDGHPRQGCDRRLQRHFQSRDGWPSGRPAASPCWRAPWSWPARWPLPSGVASSRP